MGTQPFDPIREWQIAYVNAGKYAGSSVLVHRSGQEQFFSCVGQRDVELGHAFMRDTVVRLYSMTKPIASLAILILVERGRLTLDTPLGAILPEFAQPFALVKGATRIDHCSKVPSPTIRQLLTHQAGFTYAFNSGLLAQEMEAKELYFKPDQATLAEHVKQLANLPLAYVPGTKWEYSVGIDVLGRVIEVISGQSLDQFIQTEILDVLEMRDTGFQVREEQIERFSALYSVSDDDSFTLSPVDTENRTLSLIDRGPQSPFARTTLFSGGGGLIGTIDDYAKFTKMLLNGGKVGSGRLVKTETVAMMLANQLDGEIADMGPTSFAEQPMQGMGFGFGGSVLLDQNRAQTAGTQGDFSWGGIASTYFWIDPHQRLSVIFMTQLLPSSAYPSRAELKALVSAASHT